MGKRRKRAKPSQKLREKSKRQQAAHERDTLRFYKSVVAIMVQRAGGRLAITGEEFESLRGSLQWRRTDPSGVEFNYVPAEELEP